MKFLLLGFIIYAPGTLLYFMTRREQGKQLFTPAEWILFAVAVVGAVVGIHGSSRATSRSSLPRRRSPPMADKQPVPFGVHSEVGQLRKVMVCAPGRAHQRLTPTNCDALLFDDVLWVENAKRDHFDFITKMRDRGVDVVEMHNLLAETVAVPEGEEVDPRQPGRAEPGRPRPGRRDQELPRRAFRPASSRRR